MNEARTVLLLGAGFSRSAGLPLMRELWSALHEEARRRLAAGEKRLPGHAHDIEAEIANVGRMGWKCALGGLAFGANRGPEDLELFLTALEEIREAGKAGFVADDDKQAAWNAREALVCWMSLALDRLSEQARAKMDGLATLERLIGALTPGDALVTLNYDTLAESALDRSGLSWRYAGTTDPATITVSKPHGSLNWSWTPGSVPVHRRHWTWVAPGPDPVGSLADRPLGFHDWGVSKDGDSALIVAPTRRKLTAAQFLQSQVAEAIVALAESEVLVIVGYSLPQHDDLVATALRTGALLAARRRGGLLPTLVVDPNPDVVGRYAALGLAAERVADCLENFDPVLIGRGGLAGGDGRGVGRGARRVDPAPESITGGSGR